MLGFVWSPVNLFPLHGGEKGFCNSVIMWAAGFGEGLDKSFPFSISVGSHAHHFWDNQYDQFNKDDHVIYYALKDCKKNRIEDVIIMKSEEGGVDLWDCRDFVFCHLSCGTHTGTTTKFKGKILNRSPYYWGSSESQPEDLFQFVKSAFEKQKGVRLDVEFAGGYVASPDGTLPVPPQEASRLYASRKHTYLPCPAVRAQGLSGGYSDEFDLYFHQPVPPQYPAI